ncbi:hypothetical protein BASA62_010043 [Batrachochytrium salamandrivorans]|nr:hypothetical protein BASA62_010043 [Batrachochytrium salamandrivorans]
MAAILESFGFALTVSAMLAARASDADMASPNTVTVDTTGTVPVEIYYEVHGSGPHKILFVNGMSSVAHLWDLQIDYFLKFPEFSMCIFDNRGSGLSSAPIGRYTTTLMAKDAFALLEHLGWHKDIHIVALSMGGMIAQELAYMLGDTIQSMCLVSTFCKFNGVPAQLTSLTGMLKRITPHLPTMETYTCVMAWLDEPCTRDSTYATNREYANKFFNDRLSESGFQSHAGRAGQHAAVLSHFFDERLSLLRKHKFSILIISGDQDQVVRQPVSSEYLAERLNARLEIYPGGGHALRFQDPDWHNRHVHDNIKAGLLIAQTSQPPDDLIKLASS